MKNHICVYPKYCKFPACNCDQPEKVKTERPFYDSVWPSQNRTKWGTHTPDLSFELKKPTFPDAPPNPPSGGPIETKPVDPNHPRYVYYVGGDQYRSRHSIAACKKSFFEDNPQEKDAATWIFIAVDGPSRIERLS